MVNWTDNQQLAIDSRNKNLLLSAAAGSGKTAVLVERIIQLIIKDNADIDRFLIVTFTNAAAGEMRDRIGKALYLAIEEGIGDEQHLRRQIQLLDRAFISTLHSFCIDIVKKYFHLIDIDPIFRIGDSTETTLLKLEALEELFESQYEKEDKSFLELVEMYGGSRNDLGLQNLVIGLYDFIQSKPQPEDWLVERVEDFSMDEEEFSNSIMIKSLIEQLLIDIEGAINYFNEAKEIALTPGGPDVYEEIIQDDIEQVEGLKDSLKEGLLPFYEGLQTIKHKRLKPAKDADEDLKDSSKDLRNKGKDIIKDIGKKLLIKSPKEFVQELNEIYPHMKYLGKLAIDLGKLYSQKKQEKGILDFNDLEHYGLDILQHDEAVEEYRGKFDYIFVDEYQDSNLIQETIVDRIKRKDNVFLVGDVKQSIYRFRLADPSLFIEKYENYQDEESSIDRRIDLSKNFRSRKAIIDGANFIFSNLMSKEFGEIEYDSRAALYLGGDFKEIEDSQVELNIIEIDRELQEENNTDAIEELEDIEIEAHWVAKRIKELLEREIYDSKENVYRKIEYKDIVVLLRTTKGWAETYCETFVSQGIPVYADVNSGYFETIEINILMNLLKVIDNKRQDIPLLSVLRSPIFGFDTEELIKIRGASSKDTYFEALEEYIEKQDDKLTQKLKGVLNSLSQWKEASRYISIEDFIWKLLMESNYYYYVGAMPGGLQRQANIRVLLDRARQFQQTSMKGLFHFIKFVDQLKSSSGDMGTAKTLGENDNVVRIMSIHKSKGLEFPVVILGGMGKQFNLQDTRQAVLFHKDLGLGPNYVNVQRRSYNESIAKIAMKNKIKYENLSEEMRVLYVALTRPKDKLIMVGLGKSLDKKLEKWSHAIGPYNFANGKSYLDWVCPLVLRHAQGQSLRDRGEINWEEGKLIKDPSQWKVNCINSQEVTYKEYKKQLDGQKMKDKLLNYPCQGDGSVDTKIINRLNWSYENQIATKLPSKLSVTDIKKAKVNTAAALAVNIPIMTARPAFMEGKGGLSGQERGIVTHFVLQHLRLDQVQSKEDIQGQIQEMVFRELIREGEAKAIDTEGLYKFFKSPIGRRMLHADYVFREVPFNLVKKAKEVLPTLEDISSCDEEILIQGVIDCYFVEKEELILIDYKTDYYHNETMRQELVEKYRSQIQLYKEALEKIKGRRVKEAYLYLLHGNEEVRL
jgi:ATP-dependent helicase/nuclease subunit A